MTYTIQDLREGKVAIEYKGNLEKLRKVLKEAFPNDSGTINGISKYYHAYSIKGIWRGALHNTLPTQSEEDFALVEDEMIIGEYYYVQEDKFWMIGICESNTEIKGDHQYRCKATRISSGKVLRKSTSWCYKDKFRTFRKATKEEIDWLNSCIEKNKFIDKYNMNTITFTPEQQKATIEMACSQWKTILAKEFGYTIALNKDLEVTEERFKEYLSASTPPQLKKFKEMFPDYFNPKPDIKKGQLIYLKSGDTWVMRYFSHWNGDRVACYMHQEKEGATYSWYEYSITNPLLEN